MLKKALVFTALMALSTGALSAATVDFTYNYGPSTAPFSAVFNLDLFDSNLGTLTQVKFTLSATSSGEVIVINPAPPFGGVAGDTLNFDFANVTVPITVTGPAGTSVSFNVVGGYDPGGPGFTQGVGDGAHGFAFSGGTGSTTGFVNPLNFAFYEQAGGGTSPNAINVSATSASASGTGDLGLSYGGSASAQGTVIVEYTYTSLVPEPGTYAMIGGGLAALGLLRRRRA